MSLDKKILSEIERYNQINKYITEQAVPPPPPADAAAGAVPPPPPAPGGAVPPPPGGEIPGAVPQPIDVENDPDVEKIDDEGKSEEEGGGESGKEELDVTELVDSQKNIETKQEEYFNNLFSQLNNLESKLKDMDSLMNKLNSLEMKIEKYREKTPQEKLELRTYDSYPFNQKLSDFFEDKKEDIDLGHEDNEPHMIKGELYQIGKYAMDLYAILEELEEKGGEYDFPAWWQSKITTAKNMMSGAKHYLDFELKEPAIDAAVDALTGEEPHEGEPMMEGEVGEIDKLAAKIAKALKDKANQSPEDQNNIKQARKAMNNDKIDVAKKLIKPYN